MLILDDCSWTYSDTEVFQIHLVISGKEHIMLMQDMIDPEMAKKTVSRLHDFVGHIVDRFVVGFDGYGFFLDIQGFEYGAGKLFDDLAEKKKDTSSEVILEHPTDS